ncbi:putative protein bni4 [Erysiphe neolycopersici]|uniref:Protein BNI4 n=1 Tax=Erysiphe neolycopersici TaxID=212602 RepID=A0A420HTE7_9PEZI|nr:putative protein bni4 [Erysiphe neolycopersici]
MAALLQLYPQPSNTMSLIQSRPSASGNLSTKPHNQVNRHTSNNKIHIHRNSLNGINSSLPISKYPSQSFAASIAPYAFSSTPELNPLGYSTTTSKDFGTNIKTSHQKFNDNSTLRSSENENRTNIQKEASNFPLLSTRSPIGNKATLTDESAPSSSRSIRPGSAANNSSNSNQNISFSSTHNTSKLPPGRYRRAYSQSIDLSNNTSSATVQHNFNELEPLSICTFKDFSLQMPQLTDFSLNTSSCGKHERSGSHEPLRNRPKSCQSNVPAIFSQKSTQNSFSLKQDQHHLNNYRDQLESRLSLSSSNRPYSSHKHDENSDDKKPALANNFKIGSALQNDTLTVGKQNASLESPNYSSTVDNMKLVPELTVPTNVSRISSSDAIKRTFNPSPLSKPVDMIPESPATKKSFASAVNTALQQPLGSIPSPTIASTNDSPAAVHLTALKKKDGKKRKNSRLRRAFSFGSASELRNASSSGMSGFDLGSNPTERKEDMNQEYLDAEQIRIAQQQEAGGIGSGIYTGQGRLFAGSTDNLSISSTASSASIMIRKMGKGMKKSTRSIVGLFRPRNIAESSSDSSSPGVSETQVSIVNVEAERGSSSQGTTSSFSDKLGAVSQKKGKPVIQMDSKSPDPGHNDISSSENPSANRNILGGEKERSESLAAVKKGTGLVSDNLLTLMTPQKTGSTVFQVSQIIPGNDTPNSTAPSTPNDDQQGDLGNSTSAYGSDDYFDSAVRLQGSPKSQPGTPSSIGKRNTKFSPRIQFYDTWPSREYDRRGEIATCNRLTPMLAQQIKEELNSFKMEMEVHENSKIYTHFF